VKKLKRRGVAIRSPQDYIRLALDHTAFDILTDEVAYWTGFLMADGCITQYRDETPQIRLELQAGDIAHLERFKAFLGAEHRIHSRAVNAKGRKYHYGTIDVRSDAIAARLAKLGVVKNKTLRTDAGVLSHNRHFWRGVMDGDGCLTWTSSYPAVHVVGSETLMRQLCEHVAVATGIETAPRKYTDRSVWTVCIYGRKACRLTVYLYTEGDIALERKMLRAHAFASHYS
jgi:hypothetical protein